ncbi:proline-rich domain-containing protein [Roseomonas sp. CECT 9278]|uniref:proline-rich domain-containing protein n=1 Tax=Roseomonas sp. CECT 9278 TaxID=2845823 RepID=UPI001E64522E|nr:proline-rich domain-containing protein [Roseomonas sp. CECT 9278]CAH0305511.1 hypothetical protein ROS9278_04712 [Roseomonas sp. CECT 9278]
MHAAGRMGATGTMRAVMLATVAALGVSGVALAQPKPGPQGAPQQALPTAKPAPLGAPQQVQPAPRATPPQGQPAPLHPPFFAPPPAAQAPPPARAQAAPQVIPPNEPAAVTRLRSLLGADVRLSYANAQALDASGEQVRLTGVVLEQRNKRATAEEVTLNGLRADGVAEAVIRGFATTEDGNQMRVAMVRVAGLTVPRDGSGAPPRPEQVRLESLRLEGVESSGQATVRLAMASFENWVAGQPSRFALQGLDISRIEGGGMVDAVRVARVAFNGVDIASLLGAVIRQERPSTLVGRSALELDGLELAGGGRPVGRMTEMRIAADVTKPDGSGTGTLAFRGIRVETTPMIAAWLTRFGYQAIDADITSATTYEGGSGRVEVTDLSLAVREAGTLSIAFALDGLTQERMQAADFAATRLISMGLRYADASLFQRFIAAQARESRTPEPQLREQFAALAGGAMSQPGAAALDPIRDAVQRFIRGQARTIEIRANPPRPLGMADMQGAPPSPADAQRLFGITATAQ